MIDCPECVHTRYKGQVERETFKCFGGIFEPVGYWVDCDNCDGSGEVEPEDEYA